MRFIYYIRQWQTAELVLCGLLFCLSIHGQQRQTNDVTNIVKNICVDKLKDLSLKISSSELSKEKGLSKEKEAYYIYTSPEETKGFVIVSGDKRMPAVLGYSDQNDFDVNNIPPNVKYWLDSYAEYYLMLQDIQAPELSSVTSSKVVREVPPLIDSNWGQGKPYNQLCPLVGRERCATGCVATAMAQVMNLYKYPDRGKGSISYVTNSKRISVNRNFEHDINWKNILNDYSGAYSSAQANAIAELMFSCGASVRMDYNTSSGAYQWDLVPAYVENFGYDEDAAFMYRDQCTTSDWHNILVNELDNGHPVNYGGSGITGGHSFVFDGYRLKEDSSFPEYHINWGWDGDFDGYYIITDLTPYLYNFNYNQQITLGIKPDDGIAESQRYLCASVPSLSSVNVKKGDPFRITVKECQNMSYKPFKGTLHAMLISENNTSTVVGETKIIRSIEYLGNRNDIMIDFIIPHSLLDGVYSIQLCSKPDGSQEYYPVFSKQYPQITVSSSGEVEPVIVENTLLGSSELQIYTTGTNPELMSMNVYELQNLDIEPFIGELQMLLADCDGNFITSFGTCSHCEIMNINDMLSRPIELSGNLKGNFTNGDYRIYVGAQTSKSTGISYVVFYDILHPSDEYPELYVDARIHDGILSVSGYDFKIEPSEPECLRGDANGDGKINMFDTSSVVNYILGNPAQSFNTKAADANQDGEIGMPDVMFIVNYIMNGKFPDEK